MDHIKFEANYPFPSIVYCSSDAKITLIYLFLHSLPTRQCVFFPAKLKENYTFIGKTITVANRLNV